jgi:hypothetical protein
MGFLVNSFHNMTVCMPDEVLVRRRDGLAATEGYPLPEKAKKSTIRPRIVGYHPAMSLIVYT